MKVLAAELCGTRLKAAVLHEITYHQPGGLDALLGRDVALFVRLHIVVQLLGDRHLTVGK